MPVTIDDAIPEETPAPAPAPEAPPMPDGAKPYGQNVGDVVDAAEAVGGRYESIGAGRLRRLANT